MGSSYIYTASKYTLFCYLQHVHSISRVFAFLVQNTCYNGSSWVTIVCPSSAQNALLRTQLRKDLVKPLRPPPALLAFLLLRIAHQPMLRLVDLHRWALGEWQTCREEGQDRFLRRCRGRSAIDERVGRTERRQSALCVLAASAQRCEPVAEWLLHATPTALGVGERERDGDHRPTRLDVALFKRAGCQWGEVERDARTTI